MTFSFIITLLRLNIIRVFLVRGFYGQGESGFLFVYIQLTPSPRFVAYTHCGRSLYGLYTFFDYKTVHNDSKRHRAQDFVGVKIPPVISLISWRFAMVVSFVSVVRTIVFRTEQSERSTTTNRETKTQRNTIITVGCVQYAYTHIHANTFIFT